MSELAKQWREKQQQRRLEDEKKEAERNRSPEEVEAQEFIDGIPDLIEEAKGEESVAVFGGFDDYDVAGTRKGRLARLCAELRKRKRPLRSSDLAGIGALVFAWCDANDFECFLVEVDNGDEYEPSWEFCIRPKQGVPASKASSGIGSMDGRADDNEDNKKKGKGKGKNKAKKPSYRL